MRERGLRVGEFAFDPARKEADVYYEVSRKVAPPAAAKLWFLMYIKLQTVQ